MKPSGKPDAGNLPVRFDEGDGDGEGRTISTLRRWSLAPGQAVDTIPVLLRT